MIITISGANFSASNIGTLSTWTVSKSIGAGAEHRIPSYVDKNSAFDYTITLKDGYTFGTYSVTMGGQTITPTVTETSMTINIPSVTGAIRIEVKTINSSTGEPEEPEEPGVTKRKNYAPLYNKWNWVSGLNSEGITNDIQDTTFNITNSAEVTVNAIVFGFTFKLSDTPFVPGDTLYFGVNNLIKRGGNFSIWCMDASNQEIQPRTNLSTSVNGVFTVINRVIPENTAAIKIAFHGNSITEVSGGKAYLSNEVFDESTVWE